MAPIALTIAGSDSGGGAGIQADLKAMSALGVYGASVITAVTAQNNERVYSINPIDTKILKDQLEALLAQYDFAAVKIGLLVSRELAYQVYLILAEAQLSNIVVDPVVQSSSGRMFLEHLQQLSHPGHFFSHRDPFLVRRVSFTELGPAHI